MTDQEQTNRVMTRRDFIKVTGAIVIVMGTGACGASGTEEQAPATGKTAATGKPAVGDTPGTAQILVPAGEIPAADGYLLVDIEKCQGCLTCMLACSLIHEGVEGLSLSRIQIMQDSFASFPDDLTIEQCRQCVEPACLQVCPTGALAADAGHGNVRRVDAETCIGCGLCFEACPYTPSRAFLAPDEAYDGEARSRKCDLCANAPYHWDSAGGGPGGVQACVALCPVGAIAFTAEIPKQAGDGGYKVDLRDKSWGRLGYPTN